MKALVPLSIVTAWGEATITVEVARTRAEIARGLMYRDHLPYDEGMLFLMGKEGVWSFYMRNTFIPLDMIFIARDLTVVGVIANAEPCTETLRSIHKPSSYVLETNGGWAVTHHITTGARVHLGQGTRGVA